MRHQETIDCVLVGYNDVNFSTLVERTKPSSGFNGAYSFYQTNSVLLEGKRLTYTELLNRTLQRADRAAKPLHVFELPNLASCYLASYLRRRQFRTEIINLFNHEREEFAHLLSRSPTAVAITTTFYVESSPVSEIVQFVREHSPTTTVIVGGPHVLNITKYYDLATQDFILGSIGADLYVVESQGEATLATVLGRLKANRSVDDVPNLIFGAATTASPAEAAERPGKILPVTAAPSHRRTDRRPENNSMDADSIDWSLIEPARYTPATLTRTARSCAYKCSFCTFPELSGELTLASLDVIERELRHLQDAGVTYLTFIDDTFNVPLPRFKELCRMMIRNRFTFKWISHFRPANADDACFELMRQAGCFGVFLGIESGDQRVLNNMNKAAKVERYAHGIAKLHEHGIISFASLIVGFPGETDDTVRNTIDFIETAAPTFYQAGLYFHYTATPIHAKRREYGIQGSGYSWTHNTMTWQRAAAHVESMYRTITRSTVLPLFGCDFFGLPYFLTHGLSLDQFTEFLRIAQHMVVNSLQDQTSDFTAQERALDSLLAG